MSGILRSRFIYEDLNSGRIHSRISPLLAAREQTGFDFCGHFLSLTSEEKGTWPFSFIDGIRKRPVSDHIIFNTPIESLQNALESYWQPRHHLHLEISVALSGGVDSQLLTVWALQNGIKVNAFCLRSNIPGYCEWNLAEAFALKWNIPLQPIDVEPQDFLSAFPDFLKVTETPIYNLHPVSKWLLSRKLKELQVANIVTGDGADQVFRHDPDCDLYFLTRKCFQHAEVEIETPLASHEVISFVQTMDPDRQKKPILELAERLHLKLVAKKPSYLPIHPDENLNRLQELTAQWPCLQKMNSSRQICLVSSLIHLKNIMDAEQEASRCVESQAY